MEAANLIREIGLLPPEAVKWTKLADEPFIGMWRDREDMRDSSARVRHLRESEWRFTERR